MENLSKKLLEAAKPSLSKAYSPYSGFQVAAAVLTASGDIFSGCNVENASYGGTVCAERVAIWKAVSEGQKQIKALLVLTDSQDPWPPCGLCRQVISEFSPDETPIFLANLDGKIKETSVGKLCPDFFRGDHLKA